MQLSAVDDNFIAQANLGAPFQIASGRLAEKKGTTAAIRDYAHLMVVSHIPVVNALNAILQRKNIAAPPNTLLHSAYNAMVALLEADRGIGFDRDYVEGQVEYQKGNAALFQYEIQHGPTRTSKNSRTKLCPRSKIICTERSPWQKAVIARTNSLVGLMGIDTKPRGSFRFENSTGRSDKSNLIGDAETSTSPHFMPLMWLPRMSLSKDLITMFIRILAAISGSRASRYSSKVAGSSGLRAASYACCDASPLPNHID